MLILLLIFWAVISEMVTRMGGRNKKTITIRAEGDIVLVRKEIRDASNEAGFGSTDVTRIVTAVSELARNIFKYAGAGEVCFYHDNSGGKTGISIYFVDEGPGIADLELAVQPGFSTGKGLGMGLSGSKRLMDSFEIESQVGKGTTVKVSKWLNQ